MATRKAGCFVINVKGPGLTRWRQAPPRAFTGARCPWGTRSPGVRGLGLACTSRTGQPGYLLLLGPLKAGGTLGAETETPPLHGQAQKPAWPARPAERLGLGRPAGTQHWPSGLWPGLAGDAVWIQTRGGG